LIFPLAAAQLLPFFCAPSFSADFPSFRRHSPDFTTLLFRPPLFAHCSSSVFDQHHDAAFTFLFISTLRIIALSH